MMIDQRNLDQAEVRRARAIEVFEAGWTGSPDRGLLVSLSEQRVVAANPAASDELLRNHGIELVGLPIEGLMPRETDLPASYEKWRTQRTADVSVRPHAFDPDRYVRIAIWALGGFDGEYLVIVARDVDLGFRSAWETAQPLFEVSNNLVALVSGDRIVYSNARFAQQFGDLPTLTALLERCCDGGDGDRARDALTRALAGQPGRAFEVSVTTPEGASARAEIAFAPARNLAENGVVVVIVPLGTDTVHLPDSLTAREREIVELMLRGLRIPSIAAQLHLSHHTVRNHLRTIFAKCDVASQRELVERLRSGRA